MGGQPARGELTLPRQFDVYRMTAPEGQLVVVVQSDLLADLASCVVIPLASASASANEAVARLKPGIQVGENAYILMTTDMAAIPVRRLESPVTNIGDVSRDAILAAIDLLFFGI